MTAPSLADRLDDAGDTIAGLLAGRARSGGGLERHEAQCVLAMLRQATERARQLEAALTAALAPARLQALAEAHGRPDLAPAAVGGARVIAFPRRRPAQHSTGGDAA